MKRVRAKAAVQTRREGNQVMAIRISQKIVDYGIESEESPTTPASRPMAEVIQMHEKIERPEMLLGSTYKIKTPLSEHALYVTINDVVLNADTEHEQRRPFEIFINSKNMDHFQWIVALTRIISAVFRKGGDVTFMVEELRSVFDPGGGYFKKGGRYTPSLVAEIGDAIETHMRTIGLMKDEPLDESQRRMIDEKRAMHERTRSADDAPHAYGVLDGAQLCPKCRTKMLVQMDGCMTCLNCGESKCQ